MFKRILKAQRDGNILWVPYPLGLKERFSALKTGIDFLFTTKIDIHEEDGTWHEDQKFYSDERLACFLSGIETFLVGYRYRMLDLSKNKDYQALKFLEWIHTLDPDVRAAVLAEYKL